MKKLILIIALAMGVAGTSAFARDYDRDDRDGDRHGDYAPDLRRRVDHLNRMLDHVRWEADRTPEGPHMRHDIDHASFEVNRVNDLYRQGADPLRLNRKIDTVRSELHHIEVRLHGRDNDWFRWD